MIYPATYDIVLLQNSSFALRITATDDSDAPVDIAGYIFDADICYADDSGIVTSFSPSIVSASSGIVDITLSPAQTVLLAEGNYKYDLSATSPTGERYYWLKGALTVSGTCSRN